MDSEVRLVEGSFDLRYSVWLKEALNELPGCFTITDPSVSGHPIVFASDGFLKMVGYCKEEVIGRNGRMFQGSGTDRRAVMAIREAIREEKDVQVRLLNYRKDGTPFWMLFQMCPVFDAEDGRVINFVGVQVPIERNLGPGGGVDGVSLCQVETTTSQGMLRCCRREVCFPDSVVKLECHSPLGLVLHQDSGDFKCNEVCEASDLEKMTAVSAMNNILSVLTHYSELTGRSVCRKRCCLTGNELLTASLNISLGRIKQSFVLTDAFLPDMPIVYASEAFLKLTGYAKHEVLGKNCRFLSGADTDLGTRFQIKESVRTQQACTVHILNYRNDGTPFWNFLHISPVRNASGKVAFFVGTQIVDGCKNQRTGELRPERSQLSVVAAIKVAVRGLSMSCSSST